MTIDQQFNALDARLAAKFQTLKHGTAIKYGILRVKQEKRFDRLNAELLVDSGIRKWAAGAQIERTSDGSTTMAYGEVTG